MSLGTVAQPFNFGAGRRPIGGSDERCIYWRTAYLLSRDWLSRDWAGLHPIRPISHVYTRVRARACDIPHSYDIGHIPAYCPDGDPHAYANPITIAGTNIHRDANAQIFAYTYADAYARADTHAHTIAHAYPGARTDCRTYTGSNSGADTDAYPNTSYTYPGASHIYGSTSDPDSHSQSNSQSNSYAGASYSNAGPLGRWLLPGGRCCSTNYSGRSRSRQGPEI